VHRLGEMTTANTASWSRITSLDQLERLLGQPGVPSGRFANWQLQGRQIASALFPGIDTRGIPEAQAATSLINEMALQTRSTGNGTGMPGSMSDQDRNFLVSINPSLSNLPEANAIMIRLYRETERYRILANTEAQDFIRRTHTIEGLDAHMTAWRQAHPMTSIIPEHAQTRRDAEAAGMVDPRLAQQAAGQQPTTTGTPPPETTSTAPPEAARERLLAARGTPDEARHILFFNRRYNNGQPGLAERILAEQQQDAASGAGILGALPSVGASTAAAGWARRLFGGP